MSTPAIAKLAKIIVALALLLSLTPVHAARTTVFLNNSASINTAYFWADSPATTIISHREFGAASTWSAFVDQPDELFLTGNQIAANAGTFRIRFEYPAPSFSFQFSTGTWTGNTYTQATSGTGTFVQGSGLTFNTNFTHAGDIINPAPVPIPSSLFLLGSAFAGMLMLQRRREGDALSLAQADA